MRILITGGSGLLAVNWACSLRDNHDIVLGAHVRRVKLDRVSMMPVDLESSDTIESHLKNLAIDLVVHAAGMTNVDQCEREPEAAYHANVLLSQHVAIAAMNAGVKMIHISTDHFYSRNGPYFTEDSEVSPVNVYGKTKLAAEKAVIKANPGAIIIRTNFFGWGHAKRISLSDWILAGLNTGKSVPLFDDVYFTPVLADTLAVTALRLADADKAGIYNIAGEERLSKYDFGCKLANIFSFPLQGLIRTKVEDAHLTAVRPRDMSLNNEKMRNFLGTNIGDVDAFLTALLIQKRNGRDQEIQKAVVEE